jgi:hypothetical protein
MLIRELFGNHDSYEHQLVKIIGKYGDHLLQKIMSRMPPALASEQIRDQLTTLADNDSYDGIFDYLVDVVDENPTKVMAIDSIIREYSEPLTHYFWMIPEGDESDWIDGWNGFKNDPQAANSLRSMLSQDEINAFMPDVQDDAVMGLDETATPGATSAANIGTVDAPQLSPGKARGKKSYIGSPGKSGTKAPPQPKIVQPKNADGTAKNGLDMKGANLFGGGTIKRS